MALLACAQVNSQSLKGVVDIHAHSDPDSFRAIDASIWRNSLATAAFAALLKNHYEPTASSPMLRAKLCRESSYSAESR